MGSLLLFLGGLFLVYSLLIWMSRRSYKWLIPIVYLFPGLDTEKRAIVLHHLTLFFGVELPLIGFVWAFWRDYFNWIYSVLGLLTFHLIAVPVRAKWGDSWSRNKQRDTLLIVLVVVHVLLLTATIGAPVILGITLTAR